MNEVESADFAHFNPKIGNWLLWQHPFSERKKGVESVIYDKVPTTVEIWWKSVQWMLRWFVWNVYLKKKNDKVYIFCNTSRVTGPKFTNFTHRFYRSILQIFTDELLKNQNGDIAIRFRMPGLQIKVNSPILPILTLKLVAMSTFLELSEKWSQNCNLRSNTYHIVKIWWKSVQWILR